MIKPRPLEDRRVSMEEVEQRLAIEYYRGRRQGLRDAYEAIVSGPNITHWSEATEIIQGLIDASTKRQ